MAHSFGRVLVIACGLATTGTPALPHSYSECFAFHLASCLDVNGGQDPLGICQSQADAFCSNHNHGGGGGIGPMLEPVFAIEDRGQSIAVITEIDTSDLDDAQRRTLMELITAGVAVQRARQEQMKASLRRMNEALSEEGGGDQAE
jgi:hypothetical protein